MGLHQRYRDVRSAPAIGVPRGSILLFKARGKTDKDATVTYRLDFRNLAKGSACEGRDGTEMIEFGVPPRVNATPIRALDVLVSHHGMEEKFGEEWCLPDL